jgi:hypothetical protein
VSGGALGGELFCQLDVHQPNALLIAVNLSLDF